MSTGRLVLAADHRARGMVTIERYDDYLAALRAALPMCDAVMASTQPLTDLLADGVTDDQRAYLSLNRTGLAGAPWELDDRAVATCERAADLGCSGVKHMTRIDPDEPITASALELLGHVLEEARVLDLECMVEPLAWREGGLDRSTDGIVFAAVVAHDLGAPLLKVPVPDVEPGHARRDAVARVVASVGVPVLFLGGARSLDRTRDDILDEVADAIAGGAAGLAMGRAIYQDPDPAAMARLVADALAAFG
jgi:DhnA family fructose-bisphosphate aldolase class Ia